MEWCLARLNSSVRGRGGELWLCVQNTGNCSQYTTKMAFSKWSTFFNISINFQWIRKIISIRREENAMMPMHCDERKEGTKQIEFESISSGSVCILYYESNKLFYLNLKNVRTISYNACLLWKGTSSLLLLLLPLPCPVCMYKYDHLTMFRTQFSHFPRSMSMATLNGNAFIKIIALSQLAREHIRQESTQRDNRASAL